MRAFLMVSALVLCGCNTTSESETVSPPDAKAAILAHKNRLWKDADSIKGASITAPYRFMGSVWHVCVRANARNSFGGYAGEKENLIGLHDDGRAPEALYGDAPVCESKPHTPFPELDGGYRPPAPTTAKR
jgi:hypothetical protein